MWRIGSFDACSSSIGFVAGLLSSSVVCSVASMSVQMLASGLVNPDASQFEEPILQIRRRIEELSALEPEPARQTEIDELRLKLTKVSHEIYSKLTPWQKTLVARHALRP